MKLVLVCLFVVSAIHVGSCNLRGVDTFEFGVNVGRISFTASGSMIDPEKHKYVKVTVPECSELKYVRVDVSSVEGPPNVSFDWEKHVVSLIYDTAPSNPTQYTIKAKAIPNVICASRMQSSLT